MQSIYDQFAKQLLEMMLSTVGKPVLQQEVAPSEAQWIDVWYPLAQADPLKLEQIGLVGLACRNWSMSP